MNEDNFLPFSLFTLPNVGLTPTGLITRMPVVLVPVVGARDCGQENYIRAGLTESVIGTMAGPPPKITEDRKQRTHT